MTDTSSQESEISNRSTVDFQLIAECSRRFDSIAKTQYRDDGCMSEKCVCLVECIRSIKTILNDDIPSLLRSLQLLQGGRGHRLGSGPVRDFGLHPETADSVGGNHSSLTQEASAPTLATEIGEIAMRFRQSAADIDSKVQAIQEIEFDDSQPNLIEKRSRLVQQLKTITDTWEWFAISIAKAYRSGAEASKIGEVLAEQQCFLLALDSGRHLDES